MLGVAAAPTAACGPGCAGPALLRYRNGAFENILPSVGLPESVVTAMFRARRDACSWPRSATAPWPTAADASTTIARRSLMPSSSFVISIAETRDGDVWLGTRDAGLLRVQGARVTRITEGLPGPEDQLPPAAARTATCGSAPTRVARWTGTEVTQSACPPRLQDMPALAMIRDRESNLWIAAGARGLLRVNRHGSSAPATSATSLGGHVTAVFEDRDGNLWVGTTRGIERWRDGVFTTYSTRAGTAVRQHGPRLRRSTRQRTWFAPTDGGLYWLRDGASGASLRPDLPTTSSTRLPAAATTCGSAGSAAA